MQHRFLTVIFSLICLLSGLFGKAQDTLTADGLFTMARSAAFDKKDYPAAISYAKKAIALAPAYADIIIFLGRVFTWSGQPDSARRYFQMTLQLSPANEDAYKAYADLEYWNKDFERSLVIIDSGLQKHPDSAPLHLLKANIYWDLKNYSEVRSAASRVLNVDRKNAQARSLYRMADLRLPGSQAGMSYDIAMFDKQFSDPWHYISADYSRRTKNGPVTGRINFANRLNRSAVQYELEAYPRITKKLHAYLNIGHSPGEKIVFPEWRAGFSLFYNLPKAWEAEAGVRYLGFGTANFFYTVHAGKYVGQYLFGLRLYLVPDEGSNSQTVLLSARRFFNGSDHLQLSVGAGISPDDPVSSTHVRGRYSTYFTDLGYRKAMGRRTILTFRTGWQMQEYSTDKWGNQFRLGGGITYLF